MVEGSPREEVATTDVLKLRLWHGGAPGRSVGDLILPPDVTGLEFTMADESSAGGFDCISQRRDRVYVTTDRDLARVYAGTWRNPETGELGRGALYRVAVEGGLEEDEDLLSLPGLSFQAPSATVLAVYDAAVSPDASKYGRVLKRILDDHAAAKARDIVGLGEQPDP